MKTGYTLALSIIAGAMLGGGAIQGLHAQAKAPAIVVVEIDSITDLEGYKAIGQRPNEAAAAVFKEMGGRFIARSSNITALEGTPPKRYVIIAFDSLEKAQAWNNSAAQKEVRAVRNKTTKSRSFVVEGIGSM